MEITTNLIELDYGRAVRDYAKDRQPALLWEALQRLGYDNSEIQQHVDRPGWRMEQGFA
jgi:hypothetical protein